MQVRKSIVISASPEQIWRVITDIRHAHEYISAIKSLRVIEQPSEGLVGLKWQETRSMFGTDATETMWITEAEDNLFYKTRAESHGCIYNSELSIRSGSSQCELSMKFSGEAHSWFAKLMNMLMANLMNKQLEKSIEQDLSDIKQAVISVNHLKPH